MDQGRWNYSSQTCKLDTQVHPDEERQTLLAAWLHVSTAKASGGKPGQHRLEKFYQRVCFNPLYNIQKFHLERSSSYLNGTDWTKQFISKLLHLTHSQWIYCNILLHNRRQGYLHNKQAAALLREIQELSELSHDKVPESSRFLLEINFIKTYTLSP
jgi:hypothetical protein